LALKATSTTISFSKPFEVFGVDGIHPPGEYSVEIEGEEIDGLSLSAWRRTATYLRLPSLSSPQNVSELVPVQQADLEAALRKDRGEAD
jgi:hypothetical protein